MSTGVIFILGKGGSPILASGVKSTWPQGSSAPGFSNYEKTDRIKYLQAKRAFTNNPVEYMKASTGADITNIPKIEIDESYDFLEKDYR